MANDTTANPFYFDTTSSGDITTTVGITDVFWMHTSGTEIAALDSMKLTNTAGEVILEMEQPTASTSQIFNFSRPTIHKGLNVATLGGGVVFVYHT